MIKGVDVSAYQPTEFTTDGMSFALVKATEGRTWTNSRQSEQAAHARARGLVVGFYHLLWPGDIAAQARYFVTECDSIEGDLLACDWENTNEGTHASHHEKDAFLKEVKRLRPHHRVLLYCNRDFWLNIDTTGYKADGLWIADYDAEPGHPRIKASWLIHQYTDRPLDTDVARFDDRAAMSGWAKSEE
ncbi:muramidase [Mangrovactinospora gilvigrisea]|uniref:Muramidase n=1 Tax=Mangrovactinospora gilvigrisea TaxID=1428644 RepID=A0A1J7C9Z3_9ACTN|nr:GH25 family lysozyme [Mangrovactinospora gilvigrisea]OIV38340.1 muramidase [Mangrovactinospora gilvigrisea]